MVELVGAPGFRIVGHLEALRFPNGWILRHLRFSHEWTLAGPPVFVWFDSLRLPDSRMVGFLDAPGIRLV